MTIYREAKQLKNNVKDIQSDQKNIQSHYVGTGETANSQKDFKDMQNDAHSPRSSPCPQWL